MLLTVQDCARGVFCLICVGLVMVERVRRSRAGSPNMGFHVFFRDFGWPQATANLALPQGSFLSHQCGVWGMLASAIQVDWMRHAVSEAGIESLVLQLALLVLLPGGRLSGHTVLGARCHVGCRVCICAEH